MLCEYHPWPVLGNLPGDNITACDDVIATTDVTLCVVMRVVIGDLPGEYYSV